MEMDVAEANVAEANVAEANAGREMFEKSEEPLVHKVTVCPSFSRGSGEHLVDVRTVVLAIGPLRWDGRRL